jgi:AcrR family transcriptional regulator
MVLRLVTSDPEAADGRARRGERSRDAIVLALHSLIGEGVVQPTAQQVAERAKVGLRSVFRHFDDMDTLYEEVSARVQVQALALLDLRPPTTGTIEQRIKAMIARRSAFYEAVAHYKRSQLAAQRRSAFLQRQHRWLVRELRERLMRVLPELEDAPGALFESLDLVLSFDAWERLRTDQKLSRERAAEVLETTVRTLAAPLLRRARSRKRK